MDNDFKELIELTRQSIQPVMVGKGMLAVIPNTCKIESLENFQFADDPRRIRACPKFYELDSFVEYWKSFADDGSKLFADQETLTARAVFDYHAPESPSYCTHNAILALRQTVEWKTWTGSDKKEMDQEAFARFIETNSCDVSKPSAATMEEIARDIEARSESSFVGKTRLSTGSISFGYQEQTTGKVGSGKLEIPERFTIKIGVFYGFAPVELTVLFRYRIQSSKLVLSYELFRKEQAFCDAFELVCAEIEAGTERSVLRGSKE